MSYEPYADTECPRCGNTENNRDAGPYEPHWTDRELGPPDPSVHCMWCGNCGKPFDVTSDEELARAAFAPYARYYADACPHQDCHPGDHPATVPKDLEEKRGRNIALYECPRGHAWVTWWGGRHIEHHWVIERTLIDPAITADQDTESLRLLEQALGPESPRSAA